MKFIYVKFDVPGTHHWPGAPNHLNFLREPHRHLFKFKVVFEVNEFDRELEFFECQNKCQQQIYNLFNSNSLVVDFETCSCEQIAEKLLAILPPSVCYVDVSEDGENGAIIQRGG